MRRGSSESGVGSRRTPGHFVRDVFQLCKESQIVTTNPQNKQSISYVSPNTYSPQTENASCAGFHEFTEAGFAEDRKSETAKGAKSDCHRRQLRHWPVHCARARSCGRCRLH